MNATQVADLYRTFVDSDDPSWHQGVISTFLAQGYEMFRQKVIRMQPFIYAGSVDITVNGYEYDLATDAVTIMGASPTATKMSTLIEIRRITPTGRDGERITLASDIEAMRKEATSVTLVGTKLKFSGLITDTLRVWYVKKSIVDWTKIAPADTEYIDDLDDHHQLIAIYAAEMYGVRDGAAPRTIAIKQMLEASLEDFLFRYGGSSVQIGGGYV